MIALRAVPLSLRPFQKENFGPRRDRAWGGQKGNQGDGAKRRATSIARETEPAAGRASKRECGARPRSRDAGRLVFFLLFLSACLFYSVSPVMLGACRRAPSRLDAAFACPGLGACRLRLCRWAKRSALMRMRSTLPETVQSSPRFARRPLPQCSTSTSTCRVANRTPSASSLRPAATKRDNHRA